jgi:transcription termination/antitermination protein NusA
LFQSLGLRHKLARIKLSQDTLGLSLIFEKSSGVRVKDCFTDDGDMVYYIVGKNDIGKAVGRGGIHIKKIQKQLNKRVKVIAYADTVEKFIRNFVAPVQVHEIKLIDGKAIIEDPLKKTKGLLIGREGKNLQLLNRAVKRFFPVEEVEVH